MLVTHQPVQGDVPERDGPGGLAVRHHVQAEHHHPGDPEEQDVVGGDQDTGGVEGGQVLGVAGPAERGAGPQRGGEPGVQHVRVLPPAVAGRRVLAGADADDLAGRPVPDRDAVTPPQLAADAPVVHVVDPVEVARRQLRRVDADPAVADRVTGRLGQRAHLDEPLEREPGLDHGAAPAAVADRVHVGADLGHDPAVLAQRGDHGGPGLEPVEALEGPVGRDPPVLVQDRDGGQPVAAADLEVVRVVRRGDLDRAGAEIRVHVRVRDHRDAPGRQRQPHLAADQVGVAGVVGVDRHRGVAQHGLGAGGGHHDAVVAVPVPDRDEFAVLVAVVHLDVGQGGQAARAPVDDPLGAVDELVVEEPLEHGLHGAGEALVHREPLTGPVHAVTEAAHLAEDLPAGLGLPLPDPLHERLAAEVVAAQAFLGQFPLHHVLGGDARMVHAGHPQRGVALHPAPPDQRVDQRVVERVADVQRAGDVRRGDDHAEGRVLRAHVPGLGVHQAAGLPRLVQAVLYLTRHVLRWELGSLLAQICTHDSRV